MIRSYRMRLKLKKYAFNVKYGKFMGYLVSSWRIEPNLDKVTTLVNTKSPPNIKKI